MSQLSLSLFDTTALGGFTLSATSGPTFVRTQRPTR